MPDCGLITRAPPRLLLRTHWEYFWNTCPALAQRLCYPVRNRVSYQPETARSSILRSSIVACGLPCLRNRNEACTNCKCNKNSFTDRRARGDKSFRNRQRNGNTAHGQLFLISPTQPARTPLGIAKWPEMPGALRPSLGGQCPCNRQSARSPSAASVDRACIDQEA